MKHYADNRSWPRVMSVCFLSALPCLVMNVLLECIPLRPISEGLATSQTFWIRSSIGLHFIAFTSLELYRLFVPSIPSTLRQIVVMTIIVGTGTTITEYLCALWLGYPVPFCAVLTAPMFMTLMVACVVFSWGKFLKENKEVFLELQHFHTVISIIFSLAFIYPAFNYAFVCFNSTQQSWFAFLLPIIKLAVKNCVSPFVFHAFFVAICMQSAISYRTTAVLMLTDFVHAGISLYGISVLTKRIQDTRAKVFYSHRKNTKSELRLSWSELPDHIFFLVKSDPKLQEVHNIRVSSRQTTQTRKSTSPSVVTPLTVVPVEPSGAQPSGPVLQLSFTQPTTASIPDLVPKAEQQLLLQALDENERAAYVGSVLKLLHMIECLVLIEFTELIIPFVYSVYLYATFHLPNHAYHTQLRDLTEDEIRRVIGNNLVYATLELLSLVILQIHLYRKFHISAAHQLAYVLERQWISVQLKLCSWFIFIIQFSVDHFGADYSFRFNWLKNPSPPA
ncbi:hypothetical protein Poli38472_005233 [Pythium oligandrum]|uniref:Uncharacterized protein n=1 Tax=Pythium oligandrum TaxID=41045 RepID=A0A8K1CH47_PYTOL|nr:hypothetical protein Poli38472_005233 [Pythium oligandrum]|eukprot:TMW62615.1 hypothetical protein Poli38472_005233 [Pythium oligandrum]